jgi:hypothetical protein
MIATAERITTGSMRIGKLKKMGSTFGVAFYILASPGIGITE